MSPIGYCYTCDRQVEIRINVSTKNCSVCNGDFVEEWELTEPVNTTEAESNTATNNLVNQSVVEIQRVDSDSDTDSDTDSSNDDDEGEQHAENADNLDELLNLMNDEAVAGSNDQYQIEAVARTSSESRNKRQKTEELEEDITCNICFDQWANAGPHRLVSTKCGHLFGESCITRWIQMNNKCAQCNTPNQVYDIRRIFAKNLKAVDATELNNEINLRLDAEKKYEDLLKMIEEVKKHGHSAFFLPHNLNKLRK